MHTLYYQKIDTTKNAEILSLQVNNEIDLEGNINIPFAWTEAGT
jgi:hypothetical protein